MLPSLQLTTQYLVCKQWRLEFLLLKRSQMYTRTIYGPPLKDHIQHPSFTDDKRCCLNSNALDRACLTTTYKSHLMTADLEERLIFIGNIEQHLGNRAWAQHGATGPSVRTPLNNGLPTDLFANSLSSL